MRRYVAFLILLTLWACTRQREAETVAEPQHVADIASLMYSYGDLDSSTRDSLVLACRPELTAFMRTVSEDSLSDALLASWSASQAVTVFTLAVDSVFPTVKPVEIQLGHILSVAAAENLGLPERRYAAVVYGRPESVLFVDSVMLIALNHYLGADFEGYSHWPVYRRIDKTPENLPYDLAEAMVATQYPFRSEKDESNTLLANMLYQGALMYAKMLLVQDATETGALGYDALRMEWLDANEGDMWRTLVERHLLYDTSDGVIDRFIAPAPAVRVEGLEWPARAGRYLGYRIVCSYIRHHPEVKLRQLLSPDFYLSPSSLAEAQYNP